jgi:hypothetical protein
LIIGKKIKPGPIFCEMIVLFSVCCNKER